MKQILALILALCLLLCLAACGAKQPETSAPESSAASTTGTPTTAAPESTAAPTTETPTTEEPTTEVPTTEPEEALSFRGTVEGNVYTNRCLNLRFELPEGWAFFNEDQLAQANNMTGDFFRNSDGEDLMAKYGTLIDMYAYQDTDSNVNLTIQPHNTALDAYSDEQIFRLIEDMVKAQLSSGGAEVKDYQVVKVQAFGEERDAIYMDLIINGTELHEYQIWLRPEHSDYDYYGVFTVADAEQGAALNVLNGLSRLN